MKQLMFLFLICMFFSFSPKPPKNEQVIFDRIVYINSLKQHIEKNVWKGFTDREYQLPLIYYTDSFCYVLNPTERFLTSFNPKLVFESKGLKIYKTGLLDNQPFHMETSVTFGDTSTAYNHKSPFMNCSSFEITQKMVHDVNSTEQWTTMILHEYFHGFQLKHANFQNYFEKNIATTPEDTLKKVYKSQQWFKESVDKENNILLTALNVSDTRQIKGMIDSFYVLREQRRMRTRQQLNFDITPIEQTFETMEGTARFAEYGLYSHFSKKNPYKKLVNSDTAYHSYQYFKNYNIEKDQWLYMSDKTAYFYATGFNMVRLFEKLNINYQPRLFKEAGISLDHILMEHFAK